MDTEQDCKAKGGTWKDGKCINNPKPSFKSIKENYNPFKMWGSWVGGVLGMIIIPLLIVSIKCETEDWGFCLLPSYIFGFIPAFIVGFLIGYGIHSLIRNYK